MPERDSARGGFISRRPTPDQTLARAAAPPAAARADTAPPPTGAAARPAARLTGAAGGSRRRRSSQVNRSVFVVFLDPFFYFY